MHTSVLNIVELSPSTFTRFEQLGSMKIHIRARGFSWALHVTKKQVLLPNQHTNSSAAHSVGDKVILGDAETDHDRTKLQNGGESV